MLATLHTSAFPRLERIENAIALYVMERSVVLYFGYGCCVY